MVYQHSHGARLQHCAVVIRASRPSFGRMQYRRNRGLLAAADPPGVMDDVAAMQEAQSQLKIEAIIREELDNQDLDEEQRAVY
jgi:hypothetical protein